jgi:hypothetical protein
MTNAFPIQYVDESLIAGHPQAIDQLKQEMRKYFKCKFIQPKDFLGLDLTITKLGLAHLPRNAHIYLKDDEHALHP